MAAAGHRWTSKDVMKAVRRSAEVRRAKSIATFEERFWAKALVGDGCWDWAGSLMPNGYGQMSVIPWPKKEYAHRIAFTLTNGLVPEGMDVCHSCDNRRCVRPSHLWLGTRADNLQDMVRKGRSTMGARNSQAKLRTKDVLAILAASAAGESKHQLAASFGVAPGHITQILSGRRWGHVKGGSNGSGR